MSFRVPVLTIVASFAALAQTYTISTLGGGGLPANIPGASVGLYGPQSVAVDAAGNVYFADQDNVLQWAAKTGVVTVAAGSGTPGYGGDNGLARGAQLNQPHGVAVDASGNLYIADTGNQCIRRVSNGVITTVAGNGTGRLQRGRRGSHRRPVVPPPERRRGCRRQSVHRGHE